MNKKDLEESIVIQKARLGINESTKVYNTLKGLKVTSPDNELTFWIVYNKLRNRFLIKGVAFTQVISGLIYLFFIFNDYDLPEFLKNKPSAATCWLALGLISWLVTYRVFLFRLRKIEAKVVKTYKLEDEMEKST